MGSGVLVTSLYLSLTPIARLVAHDVPPRLEAELGQGLSTILARRYCDTEAARRALAHLTVRLGGGADGELHVLDTDAVNAFTLPGGAVIVTRGLLDQARGPDEVAGVLAHELEHVRLRHVMIRVVRSSIMTALWHATLGDYAGLLVIDPKTALDVTNLRFSRDDERAADRGALDRLAAGHISADGFALFFERLRAKSDVVPAWISSHPASAERLAHIRDSGTTSAGSTRPALDDTEWRSLQESARANRTKRL